MAVVRESEQPEDRVEPLLKKVVTYSADADR
jgi:hypothetical protein